MKHTIVHFEIPADDVERAKEFYSELFGWELSAPPGFEHYWVFDTGDPEQDPGGGLMERQAEGQGIVHYIQVESVADYVTKAARIASHEGATAYLRDQLVPKIRALACNDTGGTRRRGQTADHKPQIPPAKSRTPVGAIVIGSSTGGPNALASVLGALPQNLPVPVLIVQHLPENFTTFLASRLDAACLLPVREARHRTPVQPGNSTPFSTHQLHFASPTFERNNRHEKPRLSHPRPSIGNSGRTHRGGADLCPCED